MTALNKQNSQLSDANDFPLIGNAQTLVSDSAKTLATISAAAPTAVTLTYSSNDPGTTANGAVTIADGTALVAAEVFEVLDEFESSISKLVTLGVELRTDHATIITDLTTHDTKINAILDILEAHGLMKAS